MIFPVHCSIIVFTVYHSIIAENSFSLINHLLRL